MATLGKAVIEFSADTAKFVGDIGRTAAVFERSIGRMERGVESLRNAVLGIAGVGGLGAMVKSAINAGDEMNKLSQKVGITVEQLSGLKFAAELADVGVDDLTRGLKEFSKSLTEAQDPGSKSAGIFAALGIGSPSADPRQALMQVADAFTRLQDGALKTTVAAELFGKNGLAFIPLLNQGAEAIDRTTESARRLGLVMSADFARQSEQFNDNLKVLSKQGDALAISFGSRLVEGLTIMTGSLAKAAEQGNLLITVFREMSKLSGATLAEISKWVPGLMPFQGVIENAADRAFRGEPGQPVSGTIRRPEVAGPPAPDSAQLACVLSGGKWVNGQCVRGATGGGKAARDDNLVGRQLAEDMAEWDKIMAEASQLTDDFYRKQREGEQGLEAERMKAWLEFIDRENERYEIAERAAAGFDEAGNKIKEAKVAANDFGFTFNSALEDAIINGKKLSDVMKSLAQDIARMIIRKSITEPIAGAIGKAIGGIFGGGKAEGGPVMGGSAYLVGESGPELFVPGMSGAIVPNHALAAGGGQAVTINLNVQSLDPRTATSAILANMPAIAATLRQAAARRGNSTPF